MINHTLYQKNIRTMFNGLSKEGYLNLTKPAPVNYTISGDGKTAVLDIDGYIGRDVLREWMTGETSENTAEKVKTALREINTQKIIVNINSQDGDLNDGLVIKNLLESKNAEIVTCLMGFCSGTAAIVAQGGTIRRMSNTAFLQLTRATHPVCGYVNQNTLKAVQEDLQLIDSQIVKLFSSSGKATAKEIENLIDEQNGSGKWISADEALQMGLIDDIYNPVEADENTDRLSLYKKSTNAARRNLKNVQPAPPAPKPANKQQPRQKLSNCQISETAHHEAGHAILATCFNFEVDELAVGVENHSGGRGYIAGRYSLSNEHKEIPAWQNIAISAAGPMAAYGWYNGTAALYDFSIENIPVRDGVASDDGYQIQMILESVNASERDQPLTRGIQFARSRLIRNWHHLESLANNLKETRQMNAADFKQWFNKQTRDNEYYY